MRPEPIEQVTAIRSGQVLDVRTGLIMSPGTVVVRGTRIEAIGEDLTPPRESQMLDLGDATCLPGLMDLHAHILYDSSRGTVENALQRSSAFKALHGLRRAQEFLRHGFTTLRDPGDTDRFFSLVEIRDALARGEFQGPRLLVAPHPFTITGGHADLNELAPDAATLSGGIIISGTKSMREAVRTEVKYGADWIKLYASGGVMSARDDPRVQSFTNDEIQVGVEEAHRLQRKVAVHAHGTEAITASIRAGVDSVEHGSLIDDEGIRLMKERQIPLVPTLFVLHHIVSEGAAQGIPSESIAKARSLITERDRRISAAIAAGVRIAFGSDTIFPVELVPQEFRHLVELGTTPLQAIQGATLLPAAVLGIQSEVGTLEPGKQADILAVRGNPLENVRALEDVLFVMKGGEVVRLDPRGSRSSAHLGGKSRAV
jgi:imidazolonepropionase-like amidohydrolase